jgi:hypothetical protein
MIPNAAGMRLKFAGKEKRGQKKEKTNVTTYITCLCDAYH